MTDTLVDTNVILDIVLGDDRWAAWSERAFADAADDGSLVVNPVIYAELAAGYSTREDLDSMLKPHRFEREDIPWDAAYAAGLAFLAYRRRGGAKPSPLPDFFIGAHAAVRGYNLLTRDRGYYSLYFPRLTIISPDMSA
jgi:predicted nucleic acid-binding protein